MKKLLVLLILSVTVSLFDAIAQKDRFTPSGDEINTMNAALKADPNLAGLKLVGLSAHDSSDGSIEIFRQEFPDAFVDLKVGERIIRINVSDSTKL